MAEISEESGLAGTQVKQFRRYRCAPKALTHLLSTPIWIRASAYFIFVRIHSLLSVEKWITIERCSLFFLFANRPVFSRPFLILRYKLSSLSTERPVNFLPSHLAPILCIGQKIVNSLKFINYLRIVARFVFAKFINFKELSSTKPDASGDYRVKCRHGTPITSGKWVAFNREINRRENF